MLVHTDSVKVETKGEFNVVDITDQLQEITKKSKVNNGIMNVFLPGATGAIVINQYEKSLIKDYKAVIQDIVKDGLPYEHYGNARSHIRSLVLSPSVSVPIRDGKIELGTWQSILMIELDIRPRNRKINVTIVGSIKLQEEF